MASGALTHQPSTLAESGLRGLPNEVLYIICCSLPVESRIALALTCARTFHGIRIEKLKGKKLTKLLLLLERDSPTRFVCFGCRKLRRLVRHPTQGWDNTGHELCGDHRKGELTFSHEITVDRTWVHCIRTTTYELRFNLHRWQPRKDGPKISFSEAHLVMSRHRYGPRYGLSLDTLKQEFNFDFFIRLWTQDYFPLDGYPPGGRYGLRPEEPREFNQSMYQEALVRFARPGWPINGLGLWSLGHTYDAMVVGDELHVVRLHRVSSMMVQRRRFLNVMNWLRLPICNHFGEEDPWDYEDSIDPWYALLNEVLGSRFSTGKGDVFAGNLAAKYVEGSCRHCFTDYELLVERDENSWTLELVTYHRLGRCQTPDDPIWQCLASPSRHFGIGRETFDPSFGPGRTREKWYEALKALPGAINI